MYYVFKVENRKPIKLVYVNSVKIVENMEDAIKYCHNFSSDENSLQINKCEISDADYLVKHNDTAKFFKVIEK